MNSAGLAVQFLRPEPLATFLATFGRGAAFMYAAPVISDRQLPHKLRAAAAALCALAVFPLRTPLQPDALILALPCEIVLGLAAGFAARVVIAGASSGAELVGMQLGLGFAGAYDPSLGEVALPARRLVMVLCGIAFVLSGGIEASVHVLAAPPVVTGSLPRTFAALIERTGEILPVAVRFAAPVLLAAMVANLAMGLMSRAAPALNVFSVMLTLVLMVGLGILLLAGPAFVRELTSVGTRSVDAILQAVPR